MTVQVGRQEIKLGWEALVGIIFFTVSTTAAITMYFNRQDTKLDKIIAWQNVHGVKDSIQDIKLDSIFSWHIKGVTERNNMKQDIHFLMNRASSTRTSIGYFTEHRVNGHVILEKAKQIN